MAARITLLVALCGGADALRAIGAPRRPALVAPRAAAPAMFGPMEVMQLIAEEAEAQEIDALLIGQMSVAAGMIIAGFGLEEFTEVEEEGVAEPPKKEGEVDIYRDSLLRYCGYANEVGEAFRPLVPVEVVYFTYVIAITYILADGVDKGSKGAEMGGAVTGALGGTDAFCWQMLASVLFPSYIINRAVLLLVSLQAEGSLPPPLDASWVPTVVGLILIPLIIVPLDVLAHFTMNSSYRRIGKSVLGEA